MVWDDILEAEENIGVLIDAELEVHHRLVGHRQPLPQCPVCRAHAVPARHLAGR